VAARIWRSVCRGARPRTKSTDSGILSTGEYCWFVFCSANQPTGRDELGPTSSNCTVRGPISEDRKQTENGSAGHEAKRIWAQRHQRLRPYRTRAFGGHRHRARERRVIGQRKTFRDLDTDEAFSVTGGIGFLRAHSSGRSCSVQTDHYRASTMHK